MDFTPHISALREIVGDPHVITDEREKASYETPWRGDAGIAAFVVRPGSTEEVSKTLSYFSQHEIDYVAQTGNTGLMSASTPDSSGSQAVLSLSRLNEVFEINLVNRHAHVSAGVRLSKLNELCEEDGLFFPIDLGSDPCIGGMLATNTGGSRMMRYGDVRSNTLGLKAVLPSGEIVDLTNRLWKNNVGLDAKHNFIGTAGAGGIITECVVKLSPKPQQSATAFIVPTRMKALAPLLSSLEKHFGHELSAIEGMSKNSMEAAFAHNAALKNGFSDSVPDYACLIELSRTWAPRESEASLSNILQDVLGQILEEDDLIADALFGAPEEQWALRHSLSEGVQKSGKLVGFDISFTRDRAIAFREFMAERLPQEFADIRMCDFGHIGDGAMHLSLVINEGDARLQDPDFIPALRKWVFDRVVLDFGGSYSAEHGRGPINDQAYKDYTPDAVKALENTIIFALKS